MASTVLPSAPGPARAVAATALDDSQRAVLDLPDGRSAAVLGAPGSGKTRTLVEFVVDRVEHRGWGPSAVSALAPTRSTATVLRDVIASRLTVPTPGPLARTVSSLAFDVVGHAARLVGLPAPTLLSGGDQDSIVRALLEGHELDGSGPAWPDELGPTVRRLRGFRTELREVLMRTTEHRIGSEGLRRAAERAARPEWAAVADFRDEYLGVLDAARGRQLDSADLVDYAVAALDRGETSPVVDGLRVVLVDDAQEATESTLALLRALTRRGIAVVAFGDPDLSTSAFRGGTPDVLGRLGPRLGLAEVETFYLSTAHRHEAPLRDLVQRVTARIGTAGAGRQHAAGPAPASGRRAGDPSEADVPPIVTVRADSPTHEVASIARLLREHHLVRRVPWSRMMVVVRSGGQVSGVARGLQLAEVPTRTSVAGRAVRDEHAARHLLLAASVAVGRDELTIELATELLLGPLAGFDALSLRRLRLALRADELAAGGMRSADDLLVEALEGAGRFVTIDSRFAARAGRFSSSLDAARRAGATGASIEEVLWGLWERSGLAAEWSAQSDGRGIVAAEADRHLDGVVALFTAAKRFVERTPEAPAGEFLDSLLGAEVPEDTLSPQATAETVLVCSPSNAVGVEVDVVVAARLQDGVWPNLRVRGGLLAPDELVDLAERGMLDRETLGGRAGADTDVDAATEPAVHSDPRAAVLSDELRMFALTVSRATRQVVLSCTSNDDEGPSPFFRLVPPGCPEAPVGHPLSLRGLVGHLRHVLVSAPQGPRADDAVDALARLAIEGVAGASPDDWYGLRAPTTVEGLVDLDAPEAHVPVSPSQLGSFEECPLHWFVDRFGGSPPNAAMGLGTVLHDVMEHAGGVDVDSLWQAVEQRWPELEFESAWIAESEKRRARSMTESLSAYLLDFEASGGTLLGAESTFTLDVGPARLRGSIDRVERTREGAAVIVDLKTGRSAPTSPQAVAEHPQLGSYQLALAEGAVEAVPEGTPPGGAKLVIVSSGVRGKLYREPAQGAFDADRLAAFRARVVDAAEHMAGRVFVARLDDHCEGRHGGSCRIHVVGEVSGS